MAKKPYNRTVFQSFALISQFGIMMMVPIVMMFALGWWLDLKLETSFFTVVLFFVGALAGGNNVYRLAKRVYGRKEKSDD